jgi:hypothetical protein
MTIVLKLILNVFTFMVLCCSKLIVSTLPYSKLQKLIGKDFNQSIRTADPNQEKKALTIGRSISKVQRALPCKSNCLDQSFACYFICNLFKIPNELVFGLKPAGERLHPHAWVELNGKAIAGGHNSLQYTALTRKTKRSYLSHE